MPEQGRCSLGKVLAVQGEDQGLGHYQHPWKRQQVQQPPVILAQLWAEARDPAWELKVQSD